MDWKYALSLELTDPGFDFSILSEWRARLMNNESGQKLLDIVLKQFKDKGWLKEKGKQLRVIPCASRNSQLKSN